VRFLDQIVGRAGNAPAVELARETLRLVTGAGPVSTVPAETWERLRAVMDQPRARSPQQDPGSSGAPAADRASDYGSEGSASRGGTPLRCRTSRERLARVATILDDADLEMIATNDVFWDEIASVESLGEQPVFDATVPGTHNFVANGISLHNSIEQDSDVVILLHREDAYERESPRAGEADLIIAKHRNGPTATVTVAFQGHYSRFVDMAPG
jgi:replicative DNA helicase